MPTLFRNATTVPVSQGLSRMAGDIKPSTLRVNSNISRDRCEACWKNKEGLRYSDACRFINSPFRCAILDDFIEYPNDEYQQQLLREIHAVDLKEKSNDLFEFSQSDDLKCLPDDKFAHIGALRQFFHSTVRSWITVVTGIDVSDEVDLSISLYSAGDVLLCHDDELDDRRLAFILYFSEEDWKESDGGLLELFNVDGLNNPISIEERILPLRNRFVFFEVAQNSFHQVSEVLVKKCRYSVAGWYHGDVLPRSNALCDSTAVPRLLYPDGDMHTEIHQWINPKYFLPANMKSVNDTFEVESQIELTEFFIEEKLELLRDDLQRWTDWQIKTPYNMRHYSSMSLDELSTKRDAFPALCECLLLLQSITMCQFLTRLTGLSLWQEAGTQSSKLTGAETSVREPPEKVLRHENGITASDTDDVAISAKEANIDSEATCIVDVRKWENGDYTLMHDSADDVVPVLELQMFIMLEDDWQDEFNGQTCYISKDDDEQLTTILPKKNCLALVYRDIETLRFVKYINHKSKTLTKPWFYDILMLFYEVGHPGILSIQQH